MKISRNNISPGTILWYRKKGSWDVACLTVKEVGQEGFSFSLKDGTIHKCSYQYASGRLYKNRNSLSTYKPGIEMARTYGGWAGRASYLGAPYDTAALVNRVLPPDDDDWVNQVLQTATSANYIDD